MLFSGIESEHMQINWVAEFIGALALVVTSVAVAPQLIRIIRVRSTAGVSPLWAMLGAISNGGWVFYTAAHGLWWATVADALCCLSYVGTVIALARGGVRPRFFAGAIWLSVFVFGFAWEGMAGLGFVLASAFIVQVSPSLWTAYRSSDLRGASMGTWLLTFIEGALWGFYGFIKYDLAVVVFGTVAVIASLLMLARIFWWVKRQKPTVAEMS